MLITLNGQLLQLWNLLQRTKISPFSSTMEQRSHTGHLKAGINLLTNRLSLVKEELKNPIGNMNRDTVRSRVAAIGLDPALKGGILWMDDALGILMDRLEKLGIADNTLICFVADHGSKGKASLSQNRH